MALLGEAIARFDWICLAFCLMTNHVHLLLETRRGNLGEGMQWLHGEYARAFNERHGLDGHLFQGRYGSRAIRSDPQLLVTAAYIAMNPVEAGLCHAPESWAWSSCSSSPPEWLGRDRLNAYFAGFARGNGMEAFDALVRENALRSTGDVEWAVKGSNLRP